MENINVLYVDDELNNLQAFKANFRRFYTVFTATSAQEAKFILTSNDIHVLITDQKMPVTIGTQLLEQAVKAFPEQTRVLLTAYAENEAILDAFQRGLIFKYVLKPYAPDALKSIIDTAYEIYNLKKQKAELYKEWLRTEEELSLLKLNSSVS